MSRQHYQYLILVLLCLFCTACSFDTPRSVGRMPSPPDPHPHPERSWLIAPPLKGEEYGDWYFLRARVSSHHILFYQLCLRDRRTGDEGWAFYERTFDDDYREYPTVVLNRKIDQKAVMKELLGIMLTREDLEKAVRKELILTVKGAFDSMKVRIQSAYAQGFLAVVDEYLANQPSS